MQIPFILPQAVADLSAAIISRWPEAKRDNDIRANKRDYIVLASWALTYHKGTSNHSTTYEDICILIEQPELQLNERGAPIFTCRDIQLQHESGFIRTARMPQHAEHIRLTLKDLANTERLLQAFATLTGRLDKQLPQAAE